MEYTLEEYQKQINDIELEAKNKKDIVTKLFAMKNNPYEIGDVIFDSGGALKIEKINFSYGWGGSLPFCVFRGIELKKDGTPKLRQDVSRKIYQNSIIKNE